MSEGNDKIPLVLGMIRGAFDVTSDDAWRYLTEYAQLRNMYPAEAAAQLADQWDQYVTHRHRNDGVVAISPLEQMAKVLRARGIFLSQEGKSSRSVIDEVIVSLRRELIKPVPTCWHQEKPHEIGRYWYRGPEYCAGTPVIVLVDQEEERSPLTVSFSSSDGKSFEIFAVETLSGEWADFK